METDEVQYRKMMRVMARRLSFAVKAGTPNASRITQTTAMKSRIKRRSTKNLAIQYVAVETPATCGMILLLT